MLLRQVKENFMLFSNHNGSLLMQQAGAYAAETVQLWHGETMNIML